MSKRRMTILVVVALTFSQGATARAQTTEQEIDLRFTDPTQVTDVEGKGGDVSLILGPGEIVTWSPEPPAGTTLPIDILAINLWYGAMSSEEAESRSVSECSRKALLVAVEPERYDLVISLSGVDQGATTLTPYGLTVTEFNFYQCKLLKTQEP